MRILVAPDSYKGSLSAKEVAMYMEEGILEVFPKADVVKIPMADGGEGTVDSMVSATNGQLFPVTVTGPLGAPVTAAFGVLGDRKTAVIEMSAASGITLVPKDQLNPLITTTYGTGELIMAALERGCSKIIVGIGGSATNDGGVGMAQAIGVRFYDVHGKGIGFGGGQLHKIHYIDMSGLDPRIAGCEITVASDVTNPLCGPQGASFVFGSQKGATPEMVRLLDEGLAHLARLLKEQLCIEVSNARGAGAAGGLGAGLMAFASARMTRGIDTILEATDFEHWVRQADLVIVGEGRTDAQTAFGKAPAGVAAAAKKYNKAVICISGGITQDVRQLYEIGMDVIIGATQAPMSLEEAVKATPASIRHAVSSVMRTMKVTESCLLSGKTFK
jgi:glycerate 2-kinase